MLTYFLPDERKFILIKLLQTCRIIVEYVIEVIQNPLQRGFTEKNILFPNVAEKKYSDFGGGKKK
jgi:hypothetical protein